MSFIRYNNNINNNNINNLNEYSLTNDIWGTNLLKDEWNAGGELYQQSIPSNCTINRNRQLRLPIYNPTYRRCNINYPSTTTINCNTNVNNCLQLPSSCFNNCIPYYPYCKCSINYPTASTADIAYTGATFYTDDPYYGLYYTINNVQGVNNGNFGLWNYDIRGRYTGSYYFFIGGNYTITMTYDNITVGSLGETYTVYAVLAFEDVQKILVFSTQVNGGVPVSITGSTSVGFSGREIPILFGIYAINQFNNIRVLPNVGFSSIQITKL
jgi:hypothetical protein